MSVIIRLQGLPWSANALDIRQYFQGLMIPEGGVHIVGGDLGDAFIAFGSDEDARQAMLMDNGKIKDARVKLLLSSRSEMQKVIEMARSQSTIAGGGGGGGPPMVNQQTMNAAMGDNQQQQRWGDMRDGNRRRDRPSRERSRERERVRDRRRRSRSRSRSPRRSRDKERDGKRKDDRDVRRSSERRGREDIRKRDDKMGDIKREPMGMMGPRPMMMMPGAGPHMMPMGFGPFGGPERIVTPGGFVPPNERMAEWRDRGGAWDDAPEGPHPPGPMRQGGFNNKDWDGPPPAGEFGRGGRSRWSRDPPSGGVELNDRVRISEVRRGDGFGFDERRGGPDGFGLARDINPERRGRGDGPFAVGRGRFMNEMGEPGGERFGKGPGPPMGRQGFEPRGRNEFPLEPGFAALDRAAMGDNFGPMERRGRDGYPMDGERDGGMDRRGPYEPLSGGRGMIRRGSDDFEGGRRMDNDSRVSNGRGQSDRFDDFPPKRPVPSGLCIEMTGMHSDVSRGDIYDFLRGLQIASDGIKLIPSDSGARSTTALVRFTSSADREEALKRNRQYLGSRSVEIVAISDSYFDKAGNSNRYNRQNADNDYTMCVMIRGLPFNFKEDEIVDLFEGMKVVSVLMERDRSGDVTGNGFVEFDSVIDAKQAANSKKKIGHKYLELSLVSRDRMVSARMTSEGKKDLDRPLSPRVNSDCCLLQGLPFNANDKDIVAFFSNVNVMPVTIHIMLNKSSQPSGDAFCEFKSVQECEQALRKNKQCIGSRVIQVKAVSRKEMMDALGIPQHPTSGSMSSLRSDRPTMRSERSSMDERRAPMDRGDRVPLLDHPNDWAMGGLEGLPRALQGFGKPGCVVGAKNVPYRASIDEMLDFFRDYSLTKENIIRRYNEKGQPTGEARVSFRTPSEAQKAVRELNQQLIGGRPCSLFLV